MNSARGRKIKFTPVNHFDDILSLVSYISLKSIKLTEERLMAVVV